MFKVEGHIPTRISDVPSWDAEINFIFISSVPECWCKSNYEKIKNFQHVYGFLQSFKGNLVE